jgi:hypothetical protein
VASVGESVGEGEGNTENGDSVSFGSKTSSVHERPIAIQKRAALNIFWG